MRQLNLMGENNRVFSFHGLFNDASSAVEFVWRLMGK